MSDKKSDHAWSRRSLSSGQRYKSGRFLATAPDHEFTVRAGAMRAQQGAGTRAAGAEVIQADLNDRDSMVRAFCGAI